MRGPGQLLGTEQSGQLAQLRVASLTDQTLIRQASSAADELLDQDPTLASFPALQQALERFEMVTHLE
jgi:RecG-like helicase